MLKNVILRVTNTERTASIKEFIHSMINNIFRTCYCHGPLLEMENKELLRLLNNKSDLMSKAFEAAEVLATPETVATARPKKRWVPVANPKS